MVCGSALLCCALGGIVELTELTSKQTAPASFTIEITASDGGTVVRNSTSSTVLLFVALRSVASRSNASMPPSSPTRSVASAAAVLSGLQAAA